MKLLASLLMLGLLSLQSAFALTLHYSYPAQSMGSSTRNTHSARLATPFNEVINDRRKPRKVVLTKSLPSICSVFIKGGVNLKIIGGQSTHKVTIKQWYPDLTIKAYKNALYICNNKTVACNQSPRPVIQLSLYSLQQLVIAGDCQVRVSNLKNNYAGLSIHHCGAGCLSLQGPVCLSNVVNTGCAAICGSGIRSRQLEILATHKGAIHLSGCVDTLLIRAFQNATVETHCLPSSLAMVQAADCAFVTVKTFGDLRAFAGGQSNIYYYAAPEDLLKHHEFSGNVLPMY